jgi:class 3 adenylate cyclase
MDVTTWLQEVGLERHEAVFRDNLIDMDVVRELTENDLEKLGLALGDRKRVMKAIASLPALETVLPPTPISAATRTRDEAERRPVTVMFCDLVGSTGLAATLDAEDWRDLVRAYLDNSAEAVTQYGGHVAKRLGDGLMALFGYPRAQENDAERAARAGLAILRALVDLNAANAGRELPKLAARIGLDSGPVVVDSAGEVFGDAPNIAARVQSAAEPGTMLVTATVRRQVAGLFIVEEKGSHELKGVPGAPTLSSQRRRPTRRGPRLYAPHWARRGSRGPPQTLGARASRRGAVHSDRRRARTRQVAARRGIPQPSRRDAALVGRMDGLAIVAEYGAAPPDRVGQAALRRRPCRGAAVCRPRILPNPSQTQSGRVCATTRTAP